MCSGKAFPDLTTRGQAHTAAGELAQPQGEGGVGGSLGIPPSGLESGRPESGWALPLPPAHSSPSSGALLFSSFPFPSSLLPPLSPLPGPWVHLDSVGLWAKHLLSPRLSFPICTMGTDDNTLPLGTSLSWDSGPLVWGHASLSRALPCSQAGDRPVAGAGAGSIPGGWCPKAVGL